MAAGTVGGSRSQRTADAVRSGPPDFAANSARPAARSKASAQALCLSTLMYEVPTQQHSFA